MGGKLGPGGYVEWEGIRGAPNEIVRFGQSDSPSMGEFTLSIGLRRNEEKTVYSAKVGFNPDDPDGFRWLSSDTFVDGQLYARSVLENMRFLELSPERMREPSIPGATILGDHGQNLPTVLEAICADADRKQTLLSWFEELTPMDVAGFEFPRDPSGTGASANRRAQRAQGVGL